jgi:hypothetical protein
MKDIMDNKGTKGSTTNKVKKLQRQYNKILVDLFDQFAAESIEEALDKNEGSFGENIQDIVSAALENLKGKVMNELGVKDSSGELQIAIGGMAGIGPGATDFLPGMKEETDEGSDDESAEHEDDESAEHEAGEQAADDDDEEKKDEEKVEESSTARYVESYILNESAARDRSLSRSRRGDQVALSDTYTSMYLK